MKTITMGLLFGLAAVKGLRKKNNKKKKVVEGRRRSIVKANSRSTPTFEEIPEEVWMEILARLPVNSLMRFKCVSKLWWSFITSRYFTNLFSKLSSLTRERRVFMSVVDKEYHGDYMLFSASPSNWDAASFPLLNQDLTLPGMGGHFVNAVRGLMCFRLGREVRIYNLTTRQLVSLPIVKSNMLEGDSHMWNYFGHDPVSDEYKVLSKVWWVSKGWRRVRSETQVLVLGARASWRNARSHFHPPPSHRPYSQGISINGVLYYGAWCNGKRCVVMSFNLASEEFNLIDLPDEAGIVWHACRANLMNYRGKIAVFECSRLITEGMLDLWVVEDAGTSKWSHKVSVLPSHQLMKSLDVSELVIRSTNRSGEVRLSGRIVDSIKMSMNVIYDLEKNRITRGVAMEPLYPRFSGAGSLQTILWDDVESIMYLEA
ncbi:putative F-box protein At3g52320 [Arabidopsis lyrata subsp. lyrata]|uniref:putative F-box protein At3g52320 n=1 Tax=Arabidopsis lyrata subsp. lyrata TaxID=81972 RepID=UPI000A29BD8E|nr:putative F-box protein At3g52320 [Arabidopsis lyrata subsp. lyrata]|eukprot:XP_020888485.1 putative F-box protein At3g52320 [Arabidopsis lyrata subsp. lyrata]